MDEKDSSIAVMATNISHMAADVSDLKAATVSMSTLVRTLTDSMIVIQNSTISREKFYEGMSEAARVREAALVVANSRIDTAKEDMDKRMDTLCEQVTELQGVAADYKSIKLWIMGLAASLIIFGLSQVYFYLVK